MTAIIIPLSKRDRCDQGECGAQAHVRVMKDRLDLVFCGHHYRDHEDALFLSGWTINDDTRDTLTTRPADIKTEV